MIMNEDINNYNYRITKYAQNDRSSLEKTMHKPIPQHLNNTGK